MKKLLCTILSAWALGAFIPSPVVAAPPPCCTAIVAPSSFTATCAQITNQQTCSSFGQWTATSPKVCKWNPECGNNKCCTVPGATTPCPIANATEDSCKMYKCAWNSASECNPKSGPCCKAKPGGTGDCSLPLMNLGHPQDVGNPLGHTFGKARCEGVNYGCVWDQTNPDCKINPPNPCPAPNLTVPFGNVKYCCPPNTGQDPYCCKRLTPNT